MTSSSKIYIAGHNGMVGSAVVRRLQSLGFKNIVTRRSSELDLTNQSAVDAFFAAERPAVVVMAAGKVGGIHANNTYPAKFIYDNLAIASNTIHAAYKSGTQRFLFLGSSCIYPTNIPQPMKESSLLTSELEPANEAYAIAKIAGLKLCEYYRKQYGVTFHSLMPTNLYGPGDNFDLEGGHVLPALMRRFHEARLAGDDSVTVWGTGTARREFLHVDDLADACLHLMDHYSAPGHVNVGTGIDLTIRELAEAVRDLVHPDGALVFDTSKPDGMPRKVLDVSRLAALGWTASTPLSDGLAATYDWFLEAEAEGNLRL